LHSRNSRLGVDFVAGSSAFDRAGKFRIVVGPCSREVFYRFRNDRAMHRLVTDTVKLFCRDALDFDLGIILADNEIAGLRLSTHAAERLGVDTFLAAQREHKAVMPLFAAAAGASSGSSSSSSSSSSPSAAPISTSAPASASVLSSSPSTSAPPR
jgi:predicted component of type VI protein secretion system